MWRKPKSLVVQLLRLPSVAKIGAADTERWGRDATADRAGWGVAWMGAGVREVRAPGAGTGAGAPSGQMPPSGWDGRGARELRVSGAGAASGWTPHPDVQALAFPSEVQ